MITTAIIDDNLVFRKLTKVLLKQSGIKEDNILLFSNGKEMYDYMQQHSNNVNILPNIIFLDLNMPVMDGWDFLNALQDFKRKYQYSPKIYVVTSSVDKKDYNSIIKIGNINGYIVKPLNNESLTSIINDNDL
ncbi:MAG: response regulator [Mesoflavibacter sp.]|uniref:response regulator n=1 Tax=Mesoflavibacter zeaxanthinifaciens TaxID=393060 RepID=UPI0026F217C8|nr:response regulator [Mesoflavibacter zeaxanthinifaciens]MCP4055515.1 response regulator [Mesoflavibacter sp.]